MALQAALAAFGKGQHDVLTTFVAKYEGVSLVLSKKNLRASCAMAVAKGLRVNTCLATLILYGNDIGDAGATAIAKALQENKECKLEKLDISSNSIVTLTPMHTAYRCNVSIGFVNVESVTRRPLRVEPGELRQNYSINMSLREVKVDLGEEDLTRYSKMNAWPEIATHGRLLSGRQSGIPGNVERFMAIPEIKMAEERKATPDILLQNAARVGLLTAYKVLTTSDEFDLDKAAARKAGKGSSDPATQEYFATYGFELYLGRYRRAPEPAYESPTCSVWMAEDMKAENVQDAKVALKVIKSGVPGAQDSFEREVRSRDKLGSLPGLVLPLIRTHKDELCLVMPAGDYSLAEFLRRRDIPGREGARNRFADYCLSGETARPSAGAR
eukprot:g6636.t1